MKQQSIFPLSWRVQLMIPRPLFLSPDPLLIYIFDLQNTCCKSINIVNSAGNVLLMYLQKNFQSKGNCQRFFSTTPSPIKEQEGLQQRCKRWSVK